MKYKKGFRLLTVGWSDGNSFVPINFALLASSNEENVLGPHKDFDKRSVAGRRRKQTQSKATDVLIDLLKTAIHSGHSAKYLMSKKSIPVIKSVVAVQSIFYPCLWTSQPRMMKEHRSVFLQKSYMCGTQRRKRAMLDSIKSIFHITDEQLEEFTTDFVNRLPKYLQVSLGYTSAVA